MKNRTIWSIIAVVVVGVVVIVSVTVLCDYIRRTAASLRAEETKFLVQIDKFEDASMKKNWKTAIQIAERLRNGAYANDERLQIRYFNLANAYFHEYRYEDAAKTARQYLIFVEKRKDSEKLQWIASLRVAQYLSFCYAKTGDAQFRTATENQIRDSLIRMPTNLETFHLYYNYGGTKYRLETREIVTDEEYMNKNMNQITTDHDYVPFYEIANSVAVWVRNVEKGT